MKRFINSPLFWLNVILGGFLFFQITNFVNGQTASPPNDAGQVLKRRASDGALIIATSTLVNEAGRDMIFRSSSNIDLIPINSVRIGVNPQSGQRLEVDGAIRAYSGGQWQDILAVMDAGRINAGVFGDGTGTTGNFSFPVALGIGNASTLNLPTNGLYVVGSVGVGVLAPDAKLHVLKTTEQLRLGYDVNNYASFTVISNGQLTITSSNNATTTVSNPAIFSRSVSLSGITAPNVSIAGQGRIYFDSTANRFRVSENGGAYVNLVNAVTPDYLINGGNYLYTSSTLWNISVGSSSIPTAKLEILNTSDSVLGLWRLNASQQKIASTYFKLGADTAFTIQNQGSDILTIKNGNVGIGLTTDPISKLTVQNPFTEAITALSGADTAYTSIAVGRTQPEARFYIVDSQGRPFTDPPMNIANDAILKIDNSARRIHFAAGAIPMLSVGSDNVTIGTTTLLSAGKLQVNGPVLLLGQNIAPTMNVKGMIYYSNSEEKFKCYEGTAWINCIGSGSGGITGSGASGQVTFWTGGSAVFGSNNLFWDSANSRLGVGTNSTDPNYKITTSGGGIKADTTNQPAGYFNSASGYGLLVNNGNVGIGTVTPVHALQVNKNNSGLYLSTGVLDSGNTNIFFGGNGTFNDSWMRVNYNGANWNLGIDRNINANNTIPPTWSNIITFGLDGNTKVNGNLGIKTTPISNALDVNGTAQATTMKMLNFQLVTAFGQGKVLTSDASGNGTWELPASGVWGQITNSTSSFVYPTTGDSIRMRLGTYQSFDYDNGFNNMGFYWNSYYDNLNNNYKFKNITAWGGTAARFSGTGYGIAYEMASGGADPVAWIRKMAIDSTGMTLENSGNLILHSTSSMSYDPGQIRFVKSNGSVAGKIYTWGDNANPSTAGVFIRADNSSDAPQFGVYSGGLVGIGKGWTAPTTYTLEVNGSIGASSINTTGLTVTGNATVQGSNVCRADGSGCPSSEATARTQCPPKRVPIDYSGSGWGDEWIVYNGCTVDYGLVLLSTVGIYKAGILQGYIRQGNGGATCAEFGFASAIEGVDTFTGTSCTFTTSWGSCVGGTTALGSVTCRIQ